MTKCFKLTTSLILSLHTSVFLSCLEPQDGKYSPFEGRTPVSCSFLRLLYSQLSLHIHTQKICFIFLIVLFYNQPSYKASQIQIQRKKRGQRAQKETKVVEGIQILKMENLEKYSKRVTVSRQQFILHRNEKRENGIFTCVAKIHHFFLFFFFFEILFGFGFLWCFFFF